MTDNEKIIIDILKKNEDFNYLITQPVNTISIGGVSRAVKGLASNYKVDPNGTIQYLLGLISLTCYIGPIKSEDVLIKPEEVEDAIRACINSYFMIVCLDRLITKYKKESIQGFSAKHTWQESWTDTGVTTFFMDSYDKSLRLEISLEDQEVIKKLSVTEFRQTANIIVSIKDSVTSHPLIGLRGLFSDINDMIKYLIDRIK